MWFDRIDLHPRENEKKNTKERVQNLENNSIVQRHLKLKTQKSLNSTKYLMAQKSTNLLFWFDT